MVSVTCGSCGTGLRENAKFCDECGAPLAVLGDTAKYKQVTVLLADVVHSMDLAGDGIFGALIALEDHAFRGCLAALAIQHQANRLAADCGAATVSIFACGWG